MTTIHTELQLSAIRSMFPHSMQEVVNDRLDHLVIEPAGRYNPIGVREYFGTDVDPDDRRASLRIEEVGMGPRLGRCYELSLVALPRAPIGTMLVHGSIHGPDEDNIRIGHGWLELPNDTLWEPARALLYDKEQWYVTHRARPERHYSRTAASALMVRSGHYGRWHESRYP